MYSKENRQTGDGKNDTPRENMFVVAITIRPTRHLCQIVTKVNTGCNPNPLIHSSTQFTFQHRHNFAFVRTFKMVTGTPSTTTTNILGTTSDDIINIGKGHPHRSLLELESIKQAFVLATHQQDADINMMQYGPGRGNASILKSIRENFHTNAADNSIMITTGSSHGLDLVSCLFTKPGDVIYVDSPAYFLAFFTFRDHYLVVEDIPTGKHGMDVDILEKKLEHAKVNNMKMPSILYTVPIANNPCAMSMTTSTMQKLVELSRRYSFKIASDEMYRFLTFPANSLVAPPSLMEFDDPSNPTVFSLNSFSKLLGPVIRLGWIHSHPNHIQKIVDGGLALSGGGCNPFTSEIVNQLLVTGEQQRIITNLKRVYEGNLKVMVESIDEFLVPTVSKYRKVHNIVEDDELVPLYLLPEGGYFLWIQLPDGLADTWELNTMATEKNKMNLLAGAEFCLTVHGSHINNGVQICFALLTSKTIKKDRCRLASEIQAAVDAKPRETQWTDMLKNIFQEKAALDSIRNDHYKQALTECNQ